MDSDHPRIRGEHRGMCLASLPSPGSSPHTRGARERGESNVAGRGIIPAYAGSTRPLRKIGDETKDHPRIRGEHADPIVLRHGNRGSSPHTRGAQDPLSGRCRRPRIIPAYAGSTRRRRRRSSERADHPRIRGEHLNSGAAHRVAQGSSPHTRGALEMTSPLWVP